jgi:hypothetical protein
MKETKSRIEFTEKEQAEIVTLTLTQTIARNVKGALTAKQLAGMLNISPKTVFKLAEGGTHPRLPRWVRRTLRSSSRHRLAAEAETLREFLGNRTEVP